MVVNILVSLKLFLSGCFGFFVLFLFLFFYGCYINVVTQGKNPITTAAFICCDVLSDFRQHC